MTKWFSDGLIIVAIAFISCNSTQNENSTTMAAITKKDWGEVDGKQVYLYTLTNKNGDVVTISNYGGTVT